MFFFHLQLNLSSKLEWELIYCCTWKKWGRNNPLFFFLILPLFSHLHWPAPEHTKPITHQAHLWAAQSSCYGNMDNIKSYFTQQLHSHPYHMFRVFTITCFITPKKQKTRKVGSLGLDGEPGNCCLHHLRPKYNSFYKWISEEHKLTKIASFSTVMIPVCVEKHYFSNNSERILLYSSLISETFCL